MKDVKSIEFEGKTYPVVVARKTIRRITMRSDRGTLYVNAPYGVPAAFIHETIIKHMKKLRSLLDKEAPLSPNHVYFLGQRCANDDAYLGTIFKSRLDDYTSVPFQTELRKKALRYFTVRVRHYEKLLGIAKPYEVRVRQMKARYGSNAKRTHTLTFALMLIHYAPSIVDAVIVHELAHYFEFNHSRKFYDMVRAFYPNYATDHAKLKQGFYR